MIVKDDAAIDDLTLKYYFEKGYDEGYGTAKEEYEKRISWWRGIVEQLRDENEALHIELNSMRMRKFYE